MERKQRRRKIGLLIGALVGVTVTTVWLCRPEPTLIDISRAIGPIGTGDLQWQWLSATELLVLKTDTDQNAIPWQGHAECWNVITGTHSPMAGLTNILNRPAIADQGTPYLWALSPNRTWLMWCQAINGDDWLYTGAVHLDGTHFLRLHNNKSYGGIFLDDQHWIEQPLNYLTSTPIADLEADRNDRRYLSNARQENMILSRYVLRHPSFVAVESWPVQGSVDISTYRTEDAASLVQSQQGAGNPREGVVPIQKNTVKLPRGASIMRAIPSPQQDTILYYLKIDHVHPVLAFLHRILPKISEASVETESLWVSKTDGSGFHEIGHIVVSLSQGQHEVAGANDHEFYRVEWLPGGKQVAFVYDRTLYVVPVK